VLRSGVTAKDYFDKYQFESDPLLLERIAAELAPLIPSDTELLGGLELGGVPIATALSLRTRLPVVFVRKHAKEYGTQRLAEGPEVTGRTVCIVEDVVTSGGQVLESIRELRALGATIKHALCVIDREAGGSEALREINVALHSLFRRTDLETVGNGAV
jgi:orotate phosphoribosyltransferase